MQDLNQDVRWILKVVDPAAVAGVGDYEGTASGGVGLIQDEEQVAMIG
ncbi:MAG: hypothetical protein PVF97_05325 [Desulfobacterales bacterium]|jgi:hypothetical protein